MNPLRILHALVRSTLIFISPIVIIGLCVTAILPNITLHKELLRQNNFYEKVAVEIKKYSSDVKENKISRSFNLQQALSVGFVGFVIADISTDKFWQDIIETNLDKMGNWLGDGKNSSETNGLKIYWPDNVVKDSVNKNNLNLTNNIKANVNQGRICTSGELTAAANDTSKLECYITDVNKLENGIEKDKLLGSFSGLDPKNFTWFGAVEGLKNILNTARFYNTTILVLYALMVGVVVFSAKLVGSSSFSTLRMVLRRSGFSTLSAVIGVFISLYVGAFFTMSANSFFGMGVNISGLNQLIQSQLSIHLWAILAPAFWYGVIASGFGWGLRLFK